jgi:hypothetical protein
MKHTYLYVTCDQCGAINKHFVQITEDLEQYTGTILRSFWCSNRECGKPQVIRYKLTDGQAEMTERLIPSEVNAPRDPEVGITIRPRASKKHYKA